MARLALPDGQDSRSGTYRWTQLDFLRGLAAILMIANHLGFHVRGLQDSWIISSFVFLGGMAPVLFFHVTGLGYGVQSLSSPPRVGLKNLLKVFVLLVADAFLWLGPERFVGLDFLGFIAVSGLLLECLRRSPRSLELALSMTVLIVLTRFGLAPWLRDHAGAGGMPSWLGFLLGTAALSGFSYPPLPWLAYPLLGFAFGQLAVSHRELLAFRAAFVSLVLLTAAAILLALGLLLAWRGSVLFRYGSMSLGFFLLSLSVLLTAIAISLIMGQSKPGGNLMQRLSLGGIQSLAVVPLHFLFRDLSTSLIGPIDGAWGYLLWLAAGVLFCFQASRVVPLATSQVRSRGWTNQAWASISVLVVASARVVVYWPLDPVPDRLLRSGVQLGLCVLFGLIPTRQIPRSAPSPVSEELAPGPERRLAVESSSHRSAVIL